MKYYMSLFLYSPIKYEFVSMGYELVMNIYIYIYIYLSQVGGPRLASSSLCNVQ